MPVRVRMSIMLWCYKIEMRGLLRATLMGPSGYPAELAAAVDLSLIMNQQRRTLRTSSPVRVTHGAQPTLGHRRQMGHRTHLQRAAAGRVYEELQAPQVAGTHRQAPTDTLEL